MTPVSPVTPDAIAAADFTDFALGFPRHTWIEFVDPSFVMHTYPDRDPKKSNQALLLPLSPVRKGQSRLIIHIVPAGSLSGHKLRIPIRSRLLISIPMMLHMRNNNILDGDNVFLHIQEQNLRKRSKSDRNPDAFFTPTSADNMVLRFRNWLRTEGGGGPFGPSDVRETSPISRRELLDRYESYTLQNKEAQKALALVNRSLAVLETLSNVILLVGGATVVYSSLKGMGFLWQTVVCLSASAFCLFLRSFLRNKIFPLFYFVDYVHAEKN